MQFLNIFCLNQDFSLNAKHKRIETNVRNRYIHPALVDEFLVVRARVDFLVREGGGGGERRFCKKFDTKLLPSLYSPSPHFTAN